MDLAQARQAARDWVDAWNSKNLDRIMAHYAEDVVFQSPTVIARLGIEDGRVSGKANLRAHFARGLQAPNLHFELLDVALGVDGYTMIYRRETGALVADVVSGDQYGHGKAVRAYYGEPLPEGRPSV